MSISVIIAIFRCSKKVFFIFSVFFIIITINSCSTLEGFWNTLLFMDTLNERDDSVEKIIVFIENKTDEMVVVRAVAFDGESVGAELTRISKQSEAKIKITKGRKINIIGGRTGARYMETECTVDSETITIYPSREGILPSWRNPMPSPALDSSWVRLNDPRRVKHMEHAEIQEKWHKGLQRKELTVSRKAG
jgi:hypothetical protein